MFNKMAANGIRTEQDWDLTSDLQKKQRTSQDPEYWSVDDWHGEKTRASDAANLYPPIWVIHTLNRKYRTGAFCFNIVPLVPMFWSSRASIVNNDDDDDDDAGFGSCQGYDFAFMRRTSIFDERSAPPGFNWNSQYIGGNKLAMCTGGEKFHNCTTYFWGNNFCALFYLWSWTFPVFRSQKLQFGFQTQIWHRIV